MGDATHANLVKEIVLFMKDKKINFASNDLFIRALSKILWVKEFDIARFKMKISSHKALFEKQPDLYSYVDLIEAIYNRQAKEKLPLTFLTREQALLRKETFGRSGR